MFKSCLILLVVLALVGCVDIEDTAGPSSSEAEAAIWKEIEEDPDYKLKWSYAADAAICYGDVTDVWVYKIEETTPIYFLREHDAWRVKASLYGRKNWVRFEVVTEYTILRFESGELVVFLGPTVLLL